ncbi:SRPBCC domain-containing protein [Natronosporangium hydrolyticum]|uniref:SRPBCC domain-containing protein n=1 Tax=Natronosporangium hydrolyticum TaxID=2811111 RepID=A0A895YJD9_9ACTN|nr:SRPBCC domain-containing protein [Natronosporangium hydrolyticum]QSB15639.1 SRPBCC domain-containing protein [Natronosporangium hydrolyticum]
MAELRLHFDLAHPRQRVWRALTEPWLLGQWFMATDLAPREGSEFELDPGTRPGFLGPITGEVVTVAAPDELVMRWQAEKLHTRVSWQLLPSGDACRLVLVQSGFIGAPAALRIAALRTTYAELFARRLPELLGRMAAGESTAAGSAAAGAPLLRPPSPVAAAETRRRRLRANAAITAWEATSTRDVRANRPGRAAPDLAGLSGAGPVRTGLARAGLAQTKPAAGQLPGPVAAPAPSARPAGSGHTRAAKAPRPAGSVDGPVAATAWLRSLAIGGAAALAAAVVFAAMVYPLDGSEGPPPVGDGPLDGPPEPGMALQPGTVPVATGARPGDGVPAGSVSAAPTGELPDPGGGPVSVTGSADFPAAPPGGGSSAPPVTPSAGPPPDGSPPDGSPPDGSPPEEPAVFDATMSTAGLPLLGGRAVAVTVNNSGSSAAEWTVTMQVGVQDVVNITGAEYARVGDEAIFTAPAGLGPGESQVFEFHLRAPVLGLIGARDPTGCQIDGQACG